MMLIGRYGAAKIALALLFTLATGYALAAVSIANTRHNLQYNGTGTGNVKADVTQPAPGTDKNQICVFCHTPHSANTAQKLPLWNKQLTTATYTTYTSDYLTSLGYPAAAPFVAGQKSRACLSCHDGTVAIGAVYNINGTAAAGTINMAGGVTTMPVGNYNLGTNLADDHPVGYEYITGAATAPAPGLGYDPELNPTPIDPVDLKVKLYADPATALNKVECQSCHDPHDGQFGKFLRKSNVNGALCKVCHNKTNFGASGHDLSNQAYTELNETQGRTRVKDYACLACHRPHNGQTLPLLKGAEQVTCYEKGCHGPNTSYAAAGNVTVGSLNIQQEMLKTPHVHPTDDAAKAGKHKDIPGGESTTQLGGIGAGNRHAECYDCHNPHQVQPVVGKSTRGTLRISAALKGTWGVEPVWPAAPVPANNAITFAAPASFTKVNPATDEYQVCLKCHSNYVTLPVGARNIAAEINPNNSSYHGIVPLIGAPYALNTTTQQNNATNFYVNQNTMAQPWAGNQAFTAAQAETCRLTPTGANCVSLAASRGRVWCSDCHNSDAAVAYPSPKSATIPSGPHGSSNANVGQDTACVSGVPCIPGASNADRMLIATIASTLNGRTPLCVRCHIVYGSGGTDVNSRNNAGNRGHGGATGYQDLNEGCFGCHMWDATITSATVYTGTGMIFPHGMNKKWAVQVGGIAANNYMVDSFMAGRQRSVNYSTTTCNPGPTVNSGCNTSRTY